MLDLARIKVPSDQIYYPLATATAISAKVGQLRPGFAWRKSREAFV
jgi:hypothetical protein